jgi:hypothetical protein
MPAPVSRDEALPVTLHRDSRRSYIGHLAILLHSLCFHATLRTVVPPTH